MITRHQPVFLMYLFYYLQEECFKYKYCVYDIVRFNILLVYIYDMIQLYTVQSFNTIETFET